MPRLKIPGSSLTPGTVGPRQVRGNPASKSASPPIQVRQYCINGYPPSAQYWNQLNEATNQAALYRAKQVFHATGRVGIGGAGIESSTASGRNRWRFAFTTGPYTTRLMAMAALAPPDSGFGVASAGRLRIYSDATESTTVDTAWFYYGANPGGTSASTGWQHVRVQLLPIEGLTANTAYYGLWDDQVYGRLISATVFELPSLTEGISGYLPQSLNADSEVLDVYRENVATVQKAIWKQQGSHLICWTVNVQSSPFTIASATPTNLVDGTSTTYSSSIPGFTLDMQYRDRLSQTSGVPVTLKVCASQSSGATGRVYLKDSTGATVLSITDGWTASAAWQSTTGYLPATEDKYYLVADNNSGGTLSVYAVSLYEYET